MPSKLKILHLEDNVTDAALIAAWLEEGGLDCDIVRVDTKEDFISVLTQCSFDLIFADRTTPTFDGLSALSLAQEFSPATPFIFISGTLDEELAITTLRNGATDYVLKHRLSRLLPAVERAIHDIESRRDLDRASHSLLEQAQLLDQANDMIVIRDLQDRVMYWNHGAERLCGWTKELALGKHLHTLLKTVFPKPAADILNELLETGHWEGELTQTTSDGRQIQVASRWTLRRDTEGVAKAILEINTDVTERRRLEQQFLQAQKLDGLGTLAGGIAHDFNNILTIVLGYASLLETIEPRNPEVDEIGATLVQAGERGAELVKQLLTFARRAQPVLAPVLLNEIVEDVCKMLRQTFPKTVAFEHALTADLQPIQADPGQIHQVLLNLCVNGRDAMPSGGSLAISTSMISGAKVKERFSEADASDYVVLRVGDTGTGMDAETKRRLFEPFFTTKEVGKGTGLGLAVVYGIVRGHKGFIHVDSELGQGTAFSLYFPAIKHAAKVHSVNSALPAKRGKGERILLVEDEPLLRQLLRTTLENAGYKVRTAVDGLDAAEIFEAAPGDVDLVLSDLGLPKLGGFEMYLRMVATGVKPKIIFCSGYVEPQLRQQIADAGIAEVLLKPCRPAQLLSLVNEALVAA